MITFHCRVPCKIFLGGQLTHCTRYYNVTYCTGSAYNVILCHYYVVALFGLAGKRRTHTLEVPVRSSLR